MRLPISGEYAADWRAVANATKDAAGWCCVRCGVAHGPCPAILTVHHLDGDKGNNAWWNLLALCQRCHLKVQAKVIPERPWLFSHSAWFRPYVCGYYAHIAGHTITRAQAEASPDEWLALGQPWLYESDGAA